MRTYFGRIKSNESIYRLRERGPWEVRIAGKRERVEVLEEMKSLIHKERKVNF